MKIGIIGAGNLGSSLVKLMTLNNFGRHLNISDKKIKKLGIGHTTIPNIETIINSDILILSVKPNEIKPILDEIKYNKNDIKLVISTVAGVSLDTLSRELKIPIIRCMTNIPTGIGKGSLTYIGNSITKEDEINKMKKIFKGPEMIEVKTEALLDMTTILIGSMPAFIAYISKTFIEFGISKGLSEEESKKLYISTLYGTSLLMRTKTPDEIISNVSSPGGVTVKGIRYLNINKINNIINESLNLSLSSISKLKKD